MKIRNSKKSIFALILAVALVCASLGTVFAYAGDTFASQETNNNVRAEDVRNGIHGWTSAEGVSEIVNMSDGSTIALPVFSELYPNRHMPNMTRSEADSQAAMQLAESYAFMNLDEATDEFMEKMILGARNHIIFSQSWTVDGAVSLVDPDGNVVPLPEFYDLFPAEWDMPKTDVSDSAYMDNQISDNARNESTLRNESASSYNVTNVFDRSVLLLAPPPNTNSPNFHTIIFFWDTLYYNTYAVTLPGATYNVGYSGNWTGINYGWITGLPLGWGARMNNINPGEPIGVRASTYSTTGNARMRIDEAWR
jgi:hypothetical protein